MQEQDKALKLAIQRFYERFPTEESALSSLRELLAEEQDFACMFCGSVDLRQDPKQRRALLCTRCKRRTYFTKDSCFAYSKKPHKFLGIIWLVGHGFVLSTAELARTFDLAWASADGMLKKVQRVVEKSMPDDAETIDSATFLQTFFRRSTRTPANEHPSAEQDVVDEKNRQALPSVTSDASVADFIDPQINNILNQFLSETPISFDELLEFTGVDFGQLSATLTYLEMGRSVVRLPGDRYKIREVRPPRKECSDAARLLASSWISTCKVLHAGISRKYLQLYLAGFWCFLDRKTWHFDALLKAMARHPKIPEEFGDYDSPALIKLEGLSLFLHA